VFSYAHFIKHQQTRFVTVGLCVITFKAFIHTCLFSKSRLTRMLYMSLIDDVQWWRNIMTYWSQCSKYLHTCSTAILALTLLCSCQWHTNSHQKQPPYDNKHKQLRLNSTEFWTSKDAAVRWPKRVSEQGGTGWHMYVRERTEAAVSFSWISCIVKARYMSHKCTFVESMQHGMCQCVWEVRDDTQRLYTVPVINVSGITVQ